jgi:hypothetical protein
MTCIQPYQCRLSIGAMQLLRRSNCEEQLGCLKYANQTNQRSILETKVEKAYKWI